MPVVNFQKRFADDVDSGKKRQTIRAMRKRPFKVGDKLYLYTGLRTKSCRKLGEEIIKNVFKIVIDGDEIYLNGFQIDTKRECEQIAKDDGFQNQKDMIEWFEKNHGLPFMGQLIKW